MSGKFDMQDYVPVAERVDAFMAQFPDGSLQSEIVELTQSRVTVRAYAYRAPTDPRPGIGHSSLDIPGSTPFTRGSEIENAETSAWGRAIAALGFEVKRGLASAEEVRNKQSERSTGNRRGPAHDAVSYPAERPVSALAQRTPEEQELLGQLAAVPGMDKARAEQLADQVGVPKGQRANAHQLRAMLAIAQPEGAPGASAGVGGEAVPASPPDMTARPSETGDPVAASVQAASDSPPLAEQPALQPGSYTPEALRTLAAAVLELDATEGWTLDSLDAIDWGRVWDALKIADPDAYQSWWDRQPREIRQLLMTAKQSPKSRRDAAQRPQDARPDAETLRMGLQA